MSTITPACVIVSVSRHGDPDSGVLHLHYVRCLPHHHPHPVWHQSHAVPHYRQNVVSGLLSSL